MLVTSANGLAVRFREDRVRPMGRTARGVRGINIDMTKGDRLVGMCAFERDSTTAALITVCERGYGKRTALSDYPTKNRGGKGVISIKTSSRNGKVQAVRVVTDEDHLILISDKGKLIRMKVTDIPIQGRATQGVRVMRLDDGEQVAAIERLAEPDDESGIAVGAPLEAADDGDTTPVDMDEVVDEDDDAEPDDDEGETATAATATPTTDSAAQAADRAGQQQDPHEVDEADAADEQDAPGRLEPSRPGQLERHDLRPGGVRDRLRPVHERGVGEDRPSSAQPENHRRDDPLLPDPVERERFLERELGRRDLGPDPHVLVIRRHPAPAQVL